MFKLRRTTILLLVAVLGTLLAGAFSADAALRRPTIPIFVDTDTGVDDATAIAWLLNERSANVVGFTTVAGNTTVENATQNVLTVLDVANRHVPVTVGASAPLVYPFSHFSKFAHGPSGLWFSQVPHDISGLPRDAPAAI